MLFTLPIAAFVLLPVGLATSQLSDGLGRWVSVFVQATCVKFPIICVVASAILLVSDHWFIRL